MELLPLGPIAVIDTAGLDDTGELGALRIERSKEMMDRTDLALLVIAADETADLSFEKEWLEELHARKTTVIGVMNQIDRLDAAEIEPRRAALEAALGIPFTAVSATDKGYRAALLSAIVKNAPTDFESPTLTGDLFKPGEAVVLVAPQDIQAPKGRLILPQVQTIRELLDKKCRVVCCTTDQIEGTLSSLAAPPKLIITDSQVFSTVYAQKPAASLLTSFSVLFARYKGDIDYFVESAAAIGAAPRRLPRADRRSLHARSGGRRHRPGQNSGDAPQTDRTRTAGRCGCRHGLSRRPHALRPGNPLRRLYVQPAPRIEPRRPGPRPARPDDQLRRGDRLPARDSRQDRILTPKHISKKSGPSDNWTAHSLSKTETIPANTISPPTGNTSYTVRAGTWPKCRS